MSRHTEILARLQEATGPDRQLDMASVIRPNAKPKMIDGIGLTAPLAILTALFTALEAQEEKP